MGYLLDHRRDTAFYLGDPCDDIHMWLDQYERHFPKEQFYTYHRSFLHNSYGVKVAAQIWGEKGRKAALIHIFRDYMQGTIQHMKPDAVYRQAQRALVYIDSHLEDDDPGLQPHIIRAWKGKSLCSLAFSD